MALKTFGSAATNTMRALQWPSVSIADIASFNSFCLDDVQNQNKLPSCLDTTGILRIPNRAGWLQSLPGDWIAIDPVSGWPFLISNVAVLGSGNFVHS